MVAKARHLRAVLDEGHAQEVAHVGLVVHHQHAHAVEAHVRLRAAPPRLGAARSAPLGGPRVRGRLDGEGRALALAGALRVHGAAVQLDEVAHDGEAEAEAAVRARAGAVRLAEALEDVGQELGRDALAGVLHLRVETCESSLRSAHVDAPAAAGVNFTALRHEVPHHLLQAVGIAERPGGSVRRERRASSVISLASADGAHRVHPRLDHRGQVDRAAPPGAACR